jgi:molybdate transport system substrate-binding protein
MKALFMTSKAVLLVFAVSNLLPHPAHCAEIRIMCPGAYVDVLTELAPGLELTTKHKGIIVRDGPTNIPNRMRAGEAVDIIILPEDALNELIRDGYIANSGRSPLARSSIGMAVRAGAGKPDISSVDALKRTLLEAKSIAYSSQISGLYLSTELFPRLGIADQIRSRMKRIDKERVGTVVARGEAEIGFQQIRELLPIQGIDYVGPLPPEVQRVTLFSVGAATRSRNSDAAQDVIRFLTSPAAAATTAKSGLEPITRQ